MELDLYKYIYAVPDFPSEGILFRDITPLLADADAFNYTIDKLVEYAKKVGANKIAGPESRGFIFGTPVAAKINAGFIPLRKPGKLPRETVTYEYALEYGTNTLCIHADAIKPGDKVLIIDDLLATGGTDEAAIKLIEKLGGEVVGNAFVIELLGLKGREKIKDYDCYSLLQY